MMPARDIRSSLIVVSPESRFITEPAPDNPGHADVIEVWPHNHQRRYLLRLPAGKAEQIAAVLNGSPRPDPVPGLSPAVSVALAAYQDVARADEAAKSTRLALHLATFGMSPGELAAYGDACEDWDNQRRADASPLH